jgi:ribose/xylose/arabinose/galactoside ABC-type transport system permease subunit
MTQPSHPDHAGARGSGRLRQVVGFALPLASLALLFVVFAIGNANFLTQKNLFNILLHSAVITILGIGVTFVIIVGEIDLSIGSIVGLSGMVGAWASMKGGLTHDGLPFPAALGAGLLCGAACGFANGFGSVALKIPSFITTLGTLLVFRGFALLMNRGTPLETGLPDNFRVLRQGDILGLPNPVWLMILLGIVAYVVLAQTPYGRRCYATGGNRTAAFLSGIRVQAVTVSTFVILGTLAGLAGMIEASGLNSAQPKAGEGYELQAIAAVVIGGGSLSGGAGSVQGTVVGALMMGVLLNGCLMIGIEDFAQKPIIGAVIIAAVAFDSFRRRLAG